MKKVLVVVDMQKDFVDGALGSKEAAAIVPNVARKIRTFDGDGILVTYDTHYDNYLETLEGKKLPVVHCIAGTPGHALDGEVQMALEGKQYTKVLKNTFGSFDLPRILGETYPGEALDMMIAVGVGTGVGVSSLISRRLGEKDQQAADNAATHGIILSAITWAIFAAVGAATALP